VRCLVDSTEGSIANLKAVRAGDLSLAVVQSDWQYHAYNGSDRFRDAGPHQALRSLFSLHGEPFTVVARTGAGIGTFDDLKGKRVNIGNPGSGQRATMEVLMQLKGWTGDNFRDLLELPPDEQSQAMCDDRVDTIVYTVGHPNRSVFDATAACDAILVEVTGPDIDQMIEQNPYYVYATIPGGMYRGNPQAVKTFGVKATVVTSTELSDEIAYQIVKSIFEDLDSFRRLHPALSYLEKNQMISDGNSAPLHAGALRYFVESGLY
jgi:TRAP transporter TAXI family solute receptor